MKTLIVELPPDAYRHLRQVADRLGRPPQVVAQGWLIERLALPVAALDEASERDKTRQALGAAGLLTELGPVLQSLADSTVRLDEVVASMARAGGKPLSEMIVEQRGGGG